MTAVTIGAITAAIPVVTTDVPPQTYTLDPQSSLYVIPFPKDARTKNPNLTPNE